MSKTIKILTK